MIGANRDFMYKKFNIVRLPFIILGLFLMSLFILLYIDNRINSSYKQEIINNEKRVIDLETGIIMNDVKSVLHDLEFLKDTYGFYINGTIGFRDVEELWKAFSEHSGKYDQIRYLDKLGNEIIRINYLDNMGYICAKKELQNKKDRYYFYETAKLDRGQYYISKLDLNIEHNVIEKPIKPMIRFSTKVYNSNGEYVGIIVLNYLAKRLLDDFEKVSKNSLGRIFLINSKGYWLAGGDLEYNWAFMYENKKELKFSNNFVHTWAAMDKGVSVIMSDEGFFVWSVLKFEDIYNQQYTKSSAKIIMGDGNFRIVSQIAISSKEGIILSENNIEKFFRIIKDNIVLFALLLLISVMAELLITFSKKAYARIKYNADHDSLTKVYNRRAGMELLERYTTDKNHRDTDKLCICFVDINGLKQVNDILGHEYGDELILTVPEIMKKIIREKDFIIRFGGDEFLIIFEGATGDIAENIWKRIVTEFDKINASENRRYIISVSHGIVESTVNFIDLADTIIKKADEAMYEEKKKIKNSGFNVIR